MCSKLHKFIEWMNEWTPTYGYKVPYNILHARSLAQQLKNSVISKLINTIKKKRKKEECFLII